MIGVSLLLLFSLNLQSLRDPSAAVRGGPLVFPRSSLRARRDLGTKGEGRGPIQASQLFGPHRKIGNGDKGPIVLLVLVLVVRWLSGVVVVVVVTIIDPTTTTTTTTSSIVFGLQGIDQVINRRQRRVELETDGLANFLGLILVGTVKLLNLVPINPKIHGLGQQQRGADENENEPGPGPFDGPRFGPGDLLRGGQMLVRWLLLLVRRIGTAVRVGVAVMIIMTTTTMSFVVVVVIVIFIVPKTNAAAATAAATLVVTRMGFALVFALVADRNCVSIAP
mmetsp:Transcript_6771/g.18932  ORF Transcript_6771/g.18932 Transcript_6771/m.18932 type:complete len:279 (+) Transcript_6771:86-922(+)